MLHRTTKSLFIIDSNPIKKKHFNVPISPIKLNIPKRNEEKQPRDEGINDLLFRDRKLTSPCDEVISALVNLKKIRNSNEELLDTLFSHIIQPYQPNLNNEYTKIKSILYVDPNLTSIMDLMIDSHSFLQKRKGISSIYSLDSDVLEIIPDGFCLETIFIINDCIENVKRVINCIEQQIRFNNCSGNDNFENCRYTIIYFKRINPISIQMMEENGIQANHIEFPIDLIPLDSDLLSLQLPLQSTISLLLNQSRSLLLLTLKSIQNQIFSQFGAIPITRGKGKFSKLVFNQIVKLIQDSNSVDILEKKNVKQEEDEEVEIKEQQLFDQLILIDRHVDLITPLLIPNHYEGLLDELFIIDSNMIVNKVDELDIDYSIPLSSNDRVYNRIRCIDINELYDSFDSIITTIKEIEPSISDMEVNRHRLLVGYLKKMIDTDDFKLHLEMQNNILNGRDIELVERYILEQITERKDYSNIIRMIVFYSQVLGGVPLELYSEWKYQIVQNYGIQSILHFNNLELTGLLVSTGSTSGSSLDSTSDENDYTTNEISKDCRESKYINLGNCLNVDYSISVGVIEKLICEWNSSETNSLASILPTPQFEFDNSEATLNLIVDSNDNCFEKKVSDQSQDNSEKSNNNSMNSNHSIIKDRKKVLVYFIGGITYSEINSIRKLGNSIQKDIIICTTSIINSRKWIDYFK